MTASVYKRTSFIWYVTLEPLGDMWQRSILCRVDEIVMKQKNKRQLFDNCSVWCGKFRRSTLTSILNCD